MKIVFSREDLPEKGTSIFLAGPTPRSSAVSSWRPHALELLKKMNAPDTVYVPEDRQYDDTEQTRSFDYHDQIVWERKALEISNVVIFWVPRHIENMPAFTTNIEYGFVSERGQPFVLGYPKDAPKMRYLDWIAREKNAPVLHTLEETLKTAISILT